MDYPFPDMPEDLCDDLLEDEENYLEDGCCLTPIPVLYSTGAKFDLAAFCAGFGSAIEIVHFFELKIYTCYTSNRHMTELVDGKLDGYLDTLNGMAIIALEDCGNDPGKFAEHSLVSAAVPDMYLNVMKYSTRFPKPRHRNLHNVYASRGLSIEDLTPAP